MPPNVCGIYLEAIELIFMIQQPYEIAWTLDVHWLMLPSAGPWGNKRANAIESGSGHISGTTGPNITIRKPCKLNLMLPICALTVLVVNFTHNGDVTKVKSR